MTTVDGGLLRGFRGHLYGSLARRGDALFELCDAMLCSPGPRRWVLRPTSSQSSPAATAASTRRSARKVVRVDTHQDA